MARLRSQVLTLDAIDAQRRETMHKVYGSYFEATTAARFEADLANKTHVLLLFDAADVLRGFSTLALYDFHFDGVRGRALFSGDTIVQHQFWGEQTLPLAWLELAGSFKAQQPCAPLYWFLITKGYRTYRYLPLFAKHYYPNHCESSPPRLQLVLDHLANERFGPCYDPATGVISFPESLGHLAPPWADVPVTIAQRPEVAFFLRRNPGYVRGDELACITELCSENLRRRARAAFERGTANRGAAHC